MLSLIFYHMYINMNIWWQQSTQSLPNFENPVHSISQLRIPYDVMRGSYDFILQSASRVSSA